MAGTFAVHEFSDIQQLNYEEKNIRPRTSYNLRWYRVKQFTYIFTFLVVLTIVAQSILRLNWYGNPGGLCTVPENVTAIRTTENAYIVVIVLLYVLEIVLRILQYLILARCICRLASSEISSQLDRKTPLSETWQTIKKQLFQWRSIVGVLLVILLLLPTTAVPIVATILDTKRLREVDCNSVALPLVITYQVLNLLTYIAAIVPRLLMALATISIYAIWNHDLPVLEDAESAGYTLPSPETTTSTQDNSTILSFTENWDASTTEFNKLFSEYNDRGEKVKAITNVFQTWFILPWIIYFLAVSIETQIKPERSEAPSLLAVIYYLLYHSTEFFSVFVPYLCGKLINSYHHRFYRHLRELQLRVHKTGPINCSRQALGCMMHFESDEHYSFVPRVFLTTIKIRMSNPLYVVFLLLGLLFTVYEKFL